MRKKEFIKEALNNLSIPLTSYTGKCIIAPIELGYREAGWSPTGFSKLTKKYFPNKRPIQPIFVYLLITFNKAYCSRCDNVLDKNEFHTNNSASVGVQGYCKPCTSSYRKESVDTNYYNSKRRKEVVVRTPLWADMVKIRDIYNKCPEGYHVDHIIPLQGINVSGLHVENNLQYLTAVENMQKGNKFEVG